MSQTIGLIAGVGRLPVILARSVAEEGARVVMIRAVEGAPSRREVPLAEVHDVSIGQWGRIVDTLKSHAVERVYLAGKISRERQFQDPAVDERFLRVMMEAGVRNDESLINAFVSDLEREGMRVGEQPDYLGHLLCGAGVLTAKSPSAQQWGDIAYGYRLAKAVSDLDIGQSVVVKDGAVLAVEAVEGTDAAIERGARLGRGGAVVVKVAKSRQDPRFDIPTVGMRTLEVMAEHGAAVLAFEAGQTFVVEKEEILSFAQEQGLVVVSYTPGMEAK